MQMSVSLQRPSAAMHTQRRVVQVCAQPESGENLGPYSLPGEASPPTSAADSSSYSIPENGCDSEDTGAQPKAEAESEADLGVTISTGTTDNGQTEMQQPSLGTYTATTAAQYTGFAGLDAETAWRDRLSSAGAAGALAALATAMVYGFKQFRKRRESSSSHTHLSAGSSSIAALEAAVYGTSATSNETVSTASTTKSSGTTVGGLGIFNVGQSIQNMRLQRQFKCVMSYSFVCMKHLQW